jgi:hypothetical protein
MSKCKCGNKLKYEDNSLLNIYDDVIGLYYCNKCNKLYDANILDFEDKYSELSSKEYKKYIKWFSNEYQEIKRQKLIYFYEGLLTPLGYYEEDKKIYMKGQFLTGGLNTYVRWLNDNTAEQYHKKYDLKYDRFGIVKANLKKLYGENKVVKKLDYSKLKFSDKTITIKEALKDVESWIDKAEKYIEYIDNDKVSPEESLNSLIEAGICDNKGNLIDQYELENNSK